MKPHNLDRRATLGLLGTAAAAAVLLPSRIASAGAASFRVTHTPAQWRQLLGAERYAVLREAATERAFTSPLLKEHRKGLFVCAGCAQPLFNSATKFESGTGWPSFWQVLPHEVITRPDQACSPSVRKCCAHAAAGISAMCSTMGRSRRACAIA